VKVFSLRKKSFYGQLLTGFIAIKKAYYSVENRQMRKGFFFIMIEIQEEEKILL
jgi:hypothetical protein